MCFFYHFIFIFLFKLWSTFDHKWIFALGLFQKKAREVTCRKPITVLGEEGDELFKCGGREGVQMVGISIEVGGVFLIGRGGE